MKNLLLVGLLACVTASAQNISQFGGIYNSFNYAYGYGNVGALSITRGNSNTGNASITLAYGQISLPDGVTVLQPLATNAPIMVGNGTNQELVTPLAIGCSTPNIPGTCRITANFTRIHGAGERVASGTVGLYEALNAAHIFGGSAIVDGAWAANGGSQSMINVAPSFGNALIIDNRTGFSGGGGGGGTVGGGTAGQFAYYAANGTTVIGHTLIASDVPTLNQSTTGNAATATALAANPTDCSGGQFANAIAANGNLTCATPSGSAAWGGITGTLSSQTDLQAALNGKQATGSYLTGIGSGDGTTTGSPSAALTLSTINSNVGTFGSSTNCVTETVNAKGLITAISQTACAGGGTGLNQLTGDVTAGPGTGSQAATLATVNSNVGTFGSSTNCITFTVNAKGLVTAASQTACAGGGGSTATAITSGTLSGLPGTCTVAQVYFATDQPAGQQLYQCSATNTWTQTINLGGSGALAVTGGSLDVTSAVPLTSLANIYSALNTFNAGLSATTITASTLTSGQCVQTGVGGILQTTGSVCGTGAGGGNTTSTTLVTGNLPVGSGANAIADSGIVATTVSTASNTQTVTNKNLTSGTNTFPTFNQSTTGNAATATAFAANPTDCGAATFATAIATNGNLTCAAVVASNITSGTFAAAQMPAFTGDITTSAGAVATTLVNTAVASGSYPNPSITVDTKGRLTAASQTSTYVGTGTTTFAAQASAGTGATVSCQSGHICDSFSGAMVLTMGTSTSTGAILIVNLAGAARTHTPSCAVTTEPTVTTAYQAFVKTFTSTVSFTVSALTAATASEAYVVTYVCGGN